MKFEAIIFDMDGTLIDSMRLWRRVDQDFLSKRGIPVPADLFDHLPQGNSFLQTAQYFKDRFGLPDTPESIMGEWTDMVTWHYEHDILLKPGAKPLLEDLHARNIPIGLGTSNSLELARKALGNNGIWDFFRSVVTGDMELLGKPFPDIYLRSSANLGIPASECLVIEDTLMGIQAAKAAGMKAIAIHDEDSLGFHPQIKDLADAFVEDFTQLKELLGL